MTLLEDFIKNHSMNWEEELTQAPYNLHITHENGYFLIKYNQIESDFDIPMVREARGIIFRESDFTCVCHPFNKFGNYGESYCPDIDWMTASVQEKIDGSLIKVWYDRLDHSWHISTNGSINAFTTPVNDYMNFGDLFTQALCNSTNYTLDDLYDELNPNFSYFFELVSPYNRVVIPYDETKLYFLGMRCMVNDEESFPENSVFERVFNIPKRYNLHTLDDVQALAEKLPWDKEGYVVCDANFNRIKIKSPSYVKAHYARNNNVMTTERIIDVILSGEENEFLIYASEYADRLYEIKNKMQTLAHEAVEQAHILFGATCEFPERKDYALNVMNLPSYMRDFLFHIYDDRIFMDYAQKWSAKDWAKYIKEGE